MIEFKNLSIGFDRKTILANLNGSIGKGDLIALMGVNGAGKSCLLKTLTQLNPPLSGDISLDGKHIDQFSSTELATNIAVVLTEKIQVDFLTVRELVLLGRSPYTNFWGIEEQSPVVAETMKLLKLESIHDRFFSDLSDGQKQRVLLARALVQEPHYLFLDEPTTYLDIPSKIELMNLLKHISKDKGVSVFFSTHDLNLVEAVVDQIWLVDAEGLLHKKSPEEMKRSGLLEKNFNL